jgi:release factor glutamine methyltransferase
MILSRIIFRGLSNGVFIRNFSDLSKFAPPDIISFAKDCTVNEAYNNAVHWFKHVGIEDSDESARHLICDAADLGYRFSDFRRNSLRILTTEQLTKYKDNCMERSKKVPIQYIIGNWDFYGLTFECKSPILIPRPETEELVEAILQSKLLQSIPNPRILDIGAGTGAIGLSLLSQLPNATCHSIDINLQAVELAQRNARSILGDEWLERYNCTHHSFRQFVSENLDLPVALRFDLVVSNPPYIPSAEIAGLDEEVRVHEDRGALDGGVDGLDIVRLAWR